MRTRIFNKMTAKEVENYLARGGDTIFVPVGVVECHSAMPIDVEQIVPEAYAWRKERMDWLWLISRISSPAEPLSAVPRYRLRFGRALTI